MKDMGVAVKKRNPESLPTQLKKDAKEKKEQKGNSFVNKMNGIGEDDRGMYIDMGKIMTKQNDYGDDDDDDNDDGGGKVVRRWRREIWR